MTWGILLAACVALIACSGNMGAGTSSSLTASAAPPTTNAAPAPDTTPATIMIGDAPADRVLSFEMKIASVSLTQSDNTVVPILTTPQSVEVTHLAGTTQPFAKLSIPQGTYVSASIVVSSAEVVFLNSNGKQVEKEFPNLNATVNLPFSPQLVVAGSPLILTLDANVAASVIIDPQTGNVTVTPTFTLVSGALPPPGQENQEDPEHGELEHIVGQVTNVSGTSFTIMLGTNGISLPFNTDSNTRFDNFSGLSALPANAVVKVEGITLQDGTLLATEVQLLSGQNQQVEQELEGIVTATVGRPVTSFTMLLHDGSGSDMNAAMMGLSANVNITSNTTFRIDDGDLGFSGFTMPSFSAATLSSAQQVEVDTGSSVSPGASVQAERITLKQQSITGTLSQPFGGQMILTVADDSSFALLTGVKTITVISNSKTEGQDDHGGSGGSGDGSSGGGGNGGSDGGSGGNGGGDGGNGDGSSLMQVRGLLFFNPDQNSFTLVAKRMRNDH